MPLLTLRANLESLLVLTVEIRARQDRRPCSSCGESLSGMRHLNLPRFEKCPLQQLLIVFACYKYGVNRWKDGVKDGKTTSVLSSPACMTCFGRVHAGDQLTWAR